MHNKLYFFCPRVYVYTIRKESGAIPALAFFNLLNQRYAIAQPKPPH